MIKENSIIKPVFSIPKDTRISELVELDKNQLISVSVYNFINVWDYTNGTCIKTIKFKNINYLKRITNRKIRVIGSLNFQCGYKELQYQILDIISGKVIAENSCRSMYYKCHIFMLNEYQMARLQNDVIIIDTFN